MSKTKISKCMKCDKTRPVAINGVIWNIDACISPLVKLLNYNGIGTVASCCGHGKVLGNIALEDGRELIIAPNYNKAREVYEKMGEKLNE
jgi:hypothetical protein